jgi:hypothetical protein
MAARWTAKVRRHVRGAHSKAFVMKAVGAEKAHQKLAAIRADDADVGIRPRPQIGIKMLKSSPFTDYRAAGKETASHSEERENTHDQFEF